MTLPVAVVISGRGSNMEAIARAAQAPGSPYRVVRVIADRPTAGGLARAAALGVPTAVVPVKEFADRAAFEAALSAEIEASGAALVALAGLVIVYILVIPPIFYGLVHLPLALRIVIAVLLMAPMAVLMGMPMPLGIRLLATGSPELIPWAWGVNGATSVMGSVAALVIAILTGFNQALVIGASIYLLAIFFITRPRATYEEIRASRRAVEKPVEV